MDDPIRIVIVDDHQMVREGLASMLRDTVVNVVGQADSMQEALRVIHDNTPDIVLLDVRLGGQSGLDVCRKIISEYPGLAVVFLTVYEDEQYVFEALRAGARGYMLKRATPDDIERVLRGVQAGETIIDPALTGKIALRASRLKSGNDWPGVAWGLTERESEVLHAICDGLSYRAVAEKLVISPDTVKTHVRSIFRKLDVSDRSQAVALSLREGIFD